ncbi:dynamin family protein [Macrococcus sp. DPC7161]|uniref:dynamin family protein n=1 Tax=Macrococcus sp. DPC7161 TaxID=2507060 RepID=UPI00100C147F|nr:dynamin family protein [Macrococcus sp. DPC7161]RXK19248.1 hypothetical protein ER639_02715 [Macrococcus sp. DPC7161]
MEKLEKIKQLYQLKKEVEKSDHFVLQNQINEVIKKVYDDQYVISFVGHFSSGKSSLINHLFNEQILPSSPVPTTSNTAQIVSNENSFIRVNLENQTYTIVESYEEIKRLNTLNHSIEAIEIHRSTPFPINTIIQDTPGVDATFKNHEHSTLKYLLISDVVFYTVEYNHIHSEKNFEQLKLLNEMGVKVYLIVNQIDKHNENELSFDHFHNEIIQNLNRYQIDIEGLYYSTIYSSIHNQFEQIKSLIHDLANNRTGYNVYFDRITNYIEARHIDFLNDRLNKILSALDIEASQFEATYNTHKNNQKIFNEQSILADENNEQLLNDEVKQTLKNAYLMPFELREKIHKMLESFTPQFKVHGLFNKAQKKKQIQDELCLSVLSHLNTLVDKEVNFQLSQYFKKFEKYLNNVPEIIDYKANQQDLVDVMVEQTTITKDYVLVYSDKLKQHIEHLIRNYMRIYIQKFIKMINMSKINNQCDNGDEDLFTDYLNLKQLHHSISTHNFEHYYIHVDESIDKLIGRKEVTLTIEEPTKKSYEKKTKETESQMDYSLAHIKESITLFDKIPYFQSMVQSLKNDISRIENNITKIVVFGAFSAGKSALINALLKERLLTSSPNPTTAAITEIHFGNQHYVTFKTQDEILFDLNQMANASETSIETWLNLHLKMKDKLDSAHKNYIEAIEKHYNKYKQHLILGDRIEITQDEIHKYSADDAHAAFVHKIEIGSLNPFIKNTIIIDSPGTGSTNSRHTKETTEIIADSDLLIYVSYYNHVFTEKDKAFLSYLNQVEIINENSQSFYIINAVDLRKDESELQLVVNYLESELLKLQINDDIYPVSSKLALEQEEPYFERFKNAVDHFVNELSQKQKIEQLYLKNGRMIQQANDMVSHFSEFKLQLDARNQQYQQWRENGLFHSSLKVNVLNTLLKYFNEQLVYLHDKMKIQLFDVIKAEVNTSQKVEEIKPQFISAVKEKLSEDLILMIPRLNKYFVNLVNESNVILNKELIQNELFTDIEFNHHIINNSLVNLDSMLKELNNMKLPKITSKMLLSDKHHQILIDQIHTEALSSIDQSIEVFKNELTDIINNEINIIDVFIKNCEQDIYSEMQQMEQNKVDASVISQIQTILNQL